MNYHVALLFFVLSSVSVLGQIDITGRYILGAGGTSVQFDWSSVSFKYTFTGTSISVKLADNINIYKVRVNGAIVSTFTTDNRANKTYPVYSTATSGTYTIMITKRTEAEANLAFLPTFYGFYVNGGSTLIFGINSIPTGRKVEAQGASYLCGYGDLGTAPCSNSPSVEDSDIAYGALVAQHFSADYSLVCWEGKGITKNYGTSIPPPGGAPTMTTYVTLDVGSPTTHPYDWSWVPDVVVINIGSNDFSTTPNPNQTQFYNGYSGIIGNIRTNYGSGVYIFATCGPDQVGNYCPYINYTVTTLQTAGDSKLWFVDLTGLINSGSDRGCANHPSATGHQKMADALITFMGTTSLGW